MDTCSSAQPVGPPPSRDAARFWWRRVGLPLLLLGLAGVAFQERLHALTTTPLPCGVDGYYYAVQLRSLLDTGKLYYPSSPLAFWLGLPFAATLGPILATKVVAAAGTSAMVFPAYALGQRAGGTTAFGLFGAALAATNAASIYLSTEFVKQGVGLTLAAGFLALLSCALERPTRPRLWVASALLVASLLAHKSAFGIACFIGAFGVAPTLVRHGLAARGWREQVVWRALPFACVTLVIAFGLLLPHRLPGIGDARLFTELFSANPDWSLATLRTDERVLYFGHAPAIAGVLALFVCFARLLRRVAPSPLEWGFVAFALVLALPWLDARNVDGLGFRLRLASFVSLPALGGIAGRVLLGWLPPMRQLAAHLGAAAGVLLAQPLARTLDVTNGVVVPAEPWVVAMRGLAEHVSPGAMVVTPYRQLAFMATWYARVRAPLRMPESSERTQVYQLLQGPLSPELARLLSDARNAPDVAERPIDLHPAFELEIVLLPRVSYEALLRQLPETQRSPLRFDAHDHAFASR